MLASCAAALALLAAACSGGAADDGTMDVVGEVPFAVGERLTYELRDGDGELIGSGTLSVEGGDGFIDLVQAYEGIAEGDEPAGTDTGRVAVNPTTLKPVRMERVIVGPANDDRYEATYDLGAAKPVVAIRSVRDGDERDSELDVRPHSYENESSLWLWRTLDFADDYEAQYISVNVLQRSRQTASLTVDGRQSITVPAGTFDTWRLQIRNGRATRVAWINAEAPHEVVQWDNGSTVYLLTEISQVESD